MLCTSARLVYWSSGLMSVLLTLMVIDFLLWLLSSLEDSVLDVSIKTLLLSSEFLSLILWFNPTSQGSLLMMWCLVILYPWIHQCVFSMGLTICSVLCTFIFILLADFTKMSLGYFWVCEVLLFWPIISHCLPTWVLLWTYVHHSGCRPYPLLDVVCLFVAS